MSTHRRRQLTVAPPPDTPPSDCSEAQIRNVSMDERNSGTSDTRRTTLVPTKVSQSVNPAAVAAVTTADHWGPVGHSDVVKTSCNQTKTSSLETKTAVSRTTRLVGHSIPTTICPLSTHG